MDNANLKYLCESCQVRIAVSDKAVFVSPNGIIPYMGYAKNRVALMIVNKCFIHRPAKKMAQDVTI